MLACKKSHHERVLRAIELLEFLKEFTYKSFLKTKGKVFSLKMYIYECKISQEIVINNTFVVRN